MYFEFLLPEYLWVSSSGSELVIESFVCEKERWHLGLSVKGERPTVSWLFTFLFFFIFTLISVKLEKRQCRPCNMLANNMQAHKTRIDERILGENCQKSAHQFLVLLELSKFYKSFFFCLWESVENIKICTSQTEFCLPESMTEETAPSSVTRLASTTSDNCETLNLTDSHSSWNYIGL